MFIFTIETILTLALITIIFFAITVQSVKTWLRQRKCQHLQFRETMACNAMCNDCNKNLGFIGAWREKVKTTQQDRG